MFVDPFENTIIWNRPLAKAMPYIILVEIDEKICKTILNITLNVQPSYTPKIKNILIENTSLNDASNFWTIKGFIEIDNNTKIFVLNFLNFQVVIKYF